MTCIIGIEHQGKVYIGGDSAAVNGFDKLVETESKLFRLGEFLIGVSGSRRMAQLVQYHLEVSRPQMDDETDVAYLVKVFADDVRRLLTEHDVTGKNSDDENTFNGCLLFGYRGRCYRMYQNYQINHFGRGVDAIGSGGEFAMASILTQRAHNGSGYTEADIRFQIETALRIASLLCNDVAEPFYVEVL